MSRWFRHYAGMMRDEKLVSAAIRSKQPVERVVWVWGALLESASEVNDGGRFDFDAGEAAYFLRVDEGDIGDILTALGALGRISDSAVVRWSDRQFESDQSKDRQKRYRERLKTSRDGGVTSRDGAVTAQETDTETDLDSSLRSEDARAPESDPDFERFWDAYPNKTGRPSAEKAFSQAIKRASLDEIMTGVSAYAAKTDDRQWCSPVRWLSDDRWKDQPAKPPDKPPATRPGTIGLSHLQNFQSREEYIAAEKARAERSFR
ncbi:hypothetical protein [Rhizobium leguminosarum]|uniref:hypothetical protein n=1 Tax=Rhizobium leguminosarum TaxID=384 RepID=UPI0021B09C81|nr:hypothetical protein [Rhizobium leguminosarum]